ncbi:MULTISPECIES: hypothetical protein [Nitrincola]|uniref:Lytic transglycosylase MltA domain-containing protein n=1 Tax=Nitrincola nitratireducens TaxID=1229521 RepID=W9UWC4_9GAMM|nr:MULTISPECIES: hypothetical protein [Nitrincola]EXJ11349.1 hypothetical protein D791_01804 [Nitrincola nitratireducens]
MRNTFFKSLGYITFSTSLVLAGFAHSAPSFQSAQPLSAGAWPNHSQDLCAVANETLKYLKQGPSYDPQAIHGGTVDGIKVPTHRIQDTLAFICQVYQEDLATGASRLTDPDFINSAFERVQWLPDQAKAKSLSQDKPLLQRLPSDQLLLTKYYVRMADGFPAKTAQSPHALYGLPFDEAHLSLEEADARRDQITRYRFGKQAILRGALETQPALAPPLIWLSRADLEGALLQGTAVLEADNQRRYFNVHRNNGIAYDRTQKPEDQERYWYFKEVPGVLGYGKDADYKIPVKPKVTVAGDIFQLGLGRVVLLQTTEHGQPTYRLTVLADTGGAFHDNLYQLDWLSGYFRDWDHYHANNRHIADYAKTWLLLKKE